MMQLPMWLSDKESASNAGDTGTGIRSLGGEDLLGEELATTPVFLPGEFRGQRSLVGCCAKGLQKSQTRLSN